MDVKNGVVTKTNMNALMESKSCRDDWFAMLMHINGFATYIPYRDYFATDFFKNYHQQMEITNELQKQICQYRTLIQNKHYSGLQHYHDYADKILQKNPRMLHIYSCSISAYVTYCLLEIAKHRGLLATIYETNAETMCKTCVDRVFADEVVIAIITAFL